MANVFTKKANRVPLQLFLAILLVVGSLTLWLVYYGVPSYARVGYEPEQPVPFSHTLHSGQLGIDCRYCHTYVDRSEHSNVPATATCMNCHNQVLPQSVALAPVRESWASGEPIEWVRIHKTPDYVYFNHSVHVNRGISCVHCHGQVNQMDEVYHAKTLSMGFCLECHRNPEEYIRPNEEVYNLDWEAESEVAQLEMGTQLAHDWRVNPPISCSGCHR